MSIPILEVRDLAVSFAREGGVRTRAVDGVSLTIHPGQALAVVGESGSGKSVTAMTLLQLVPRPPARVDRGRAMFRSRDGSTLDLLGLSDRAIRAVRGGEIGMIFQEPMTSLNPVFTIGEQIVETVRLHQRTSRRAAEQAAIESLRLVGISDAERRLRAYPHEFSGGMRQRVMIAMALVCRPRLLLADEPTTALDVTVQAQILELLRGLRREAGRSMGVMLITHDLGIVERHSDAVCVMYAGRVVEYARTDALFASPLHPYTRALLSCVPRLRKTRERLVTVAQALSDESAFAPLRVEGMASCEDANGVRPWWTGLANGADRHDGGYDLRELRPGHWVGVHCEAGPPSTSRPPDVGGQEESVAEVGRAGALFQQ